jgi:hypothetical protein
VSCEQSATTWSVLSQLKHRPIRSADTGRRGARGGKGGGGDWARRPCLRWVTSYQPSSSTRPGPAARCTSAIKEERPCSGGLSSTPLLEPASRSNGAFPFPFTTSAKDGEALTRRPWAEERPSDEDRLNRSQSGVSSPVGENGGALGLSGGYEELAWPRGGWDWRADGVVSKAGR